MLAKTTIDLKYKPSRAEADVVVKLNGFMYDRDGEAERLCVRATGCRLGVTRL